MLSARELKLWAADGTMNWGDSLVTVQCEINVQGTCAGADFNFHYDLHRFWPQRLCFGENVLYNIGQRPSA